VSRPRLYEFPRQRKAAYRDRKASATRPERKVWARLWNQARRKHVEMYWPGDESGFQAWLADIGPQPPGTVLGILCDGFDLARVGFTPGNVGWLTPDESEHYKRVNKRWEQRIERGFVPRDLHKAPIEGRKSRRLKPNGSPDTIRTDQRYWNTVLASHGLGVNAGQFLADAPQGCGRPSTGGYDSAKLDVVHGAHQRDAHGKRARPANVEKEYNGDYGTREYVAPEEFNFGLDEFDPSEVEQPKKSDKEKADALLAPELDANREQVSHESESELLEEIKA